MDPQKIGAFIAQLRKEKHYTQKDLAQLLHVTDKAISRWETGKGFPETSLLKPLSDTLGVSVGELLAGERIPDSHVKAKTDRVLIASMETSNRKIAWITLSCFVLVGLLMISILALVLPGWIPKSPVDFVNESHTTMLYKLGSGQDGLVYTDLIQTERDSGFEYYLPDGTQRYVFTIPTEGSKHPVLTYLHHSGEGMLFSFPIGAKTVMPANATLGTERRSLVDFLEENGFQRYREDNAFGRPTLQYIDGERCNWLPYTKDNVFIQICLSANEGSRLMAYDIGLIDSSLDPFFDELNKGFRLTLEDPEKLIVDNPKTHYRQWETITITAATPESGTLYYSINGKQTGKFLPTVTADELSVSFPMLGAPITVTVSSRPGGKTP